MKSVFCINSRFLFGQYDDVVKKYFANTLKFAFSCIVAFFYHPLA